MINEKDIPILLLVFCQGQNNDRYDKAGGITPFLNFKIKMIYTTIWLFLIRCFLFLQPSL